MQLVPLQHGCGFAAEHGAGFKDMVTSWINNGVSDEAGHQFMMGFSELNPMLVDPLKPSAPAAEEQQQEAPAPEPQEKAAAAAREEKGHLQSPSSIASEAIDDIIDTAITATETNAVVGLYKLNPVYP
jgi:hypothetical protein